MFSTKIAGVLAVVATVCFLLLVVFQVTEIMSYRSAPSVWPTAP
jgi:hypothetical protein